MQTQRAAKKSVGTDAPQRAWHLTSDQIQFYDDQGYLILRQWIPAALLMRLHEAADMWIAQGLQSDTYDPLHADYHFARRATGEDAFFRVDYLHAHGQRASLELLGSPQVLAVAESLCGSNFVPTYESMVFKQEDDGAVVPWHQDAVHPRHQRIFNFDLYLDRSTASNGGLRVIPGSQRQT